MIKVVATGNQSIEDLIRKFNKKVQADGILTELKKREFYEKPSVAKKRDLAARRRKLAKRGYE
jgi:small subunit ribosomal protein S21